MKISTMLIFYYLNNFNSQSINCGAHNPRPYPAGSRMEGNGLEEWEIVECDYNIRDDEKRCRLGWILDTGLSLGKKVVVTGVVISFIPILVPPLVFISALGCALSFPFGFVFASYVCADKVMSKLLPDPSPPLLMEYDYHAEIYDQKQEEEEEEEIEMVKEEVDMRIELVDAINDHYYPENANTTNAEKTDDDAAATPELRNNNEDRKFQGQDVNLEVRVDNKLTESEGSGKVTEKGEKVVEKFTTVATVKGTPPPPPPNKDKSSKGKNIHYSKDTERKGKRKTSSALKFPRKKKESIHDQKLSAGKGEGMKVISLDEKTDHEKLLSGPVGDDEDRSQQVAVVREEIKGVSSDDKEQAGEQRSMVVGSELNNDAKQVSAESNHRILLKEHEQIVGDANNMRGSEQSVKDDDVSKTSIVDVVASEVVVDVINKKMELRSATIYSDPAGENYNQAKIVADDGELKHDEDKIAEEVKKEKDVLVVDVSDYSDKGLFGEDEKMWKKMEAIRAIIGYKGPIRDSSMEELNALYLFTGIEPPSDSADFQNKLCFLMSVIGLK